MIVDLMRNDLGRVCSYGTIVAPALADMATAHRLIDQGRVADRPMFFANIPSVLDETMRVGDSHVLSLETLYTPYALKGGWEQSSEPERWLQRFATLVEGTFLDTVERWRALPTDEGASYGNVVQNGRVMTQQGPVRGAFNKVRDAIALQPTPTDLAA